MIAHDRRVVTSINAFVFGWGDVVCYRVFSRGDGCSGGAYAASSIFCIFAASYPRRGKREPSFVRA